MGFLLKYFRGGGGEVSQPSSWHKHRSLREMTRSMFELLVIYLFVDSTVSGKVSITPLVFFWTMFVNHAPTRTVTKLHVVLNGKNYNIFHFLLSNCTPPYSQDSLCNRQRWRPLCSGHQYREVHEAIGAHLPAFPLYLCRFIP